jgi:hypothetical protein
VIVVVVVMTCCHNECTEAVAHARGRIHLETLRERRRSVAQHMQVQLQARTHVPHRQRYHQLKQPALVLFAVQWGCPTAVLQLPLRRRLELTSDQRVLISQHPWHCIRDVDGLRASS